MNPTRKTVLTLILALVLFTTAATGAWAFPVQVAASPTNNLAMILSAIRSARQSILMNIYDFSEPNIADALVERIQAGVHVEVLEEGTPVGGISAAGRAIQSQLIAVMQNSTGNSRLFEMHANSDRHIKRRFRYDHAKYMVIDGKSLYIGSENYSPSGHPLAGSKGTRGWDAFVHDERIASDYIKTFAYDTDPSYGDIIVHVGESGLRAVSCTFFKLGCQLNSLQWFAADERAQEQRRAPNGSDAIEGQTFEANAVEPVNSPDTSRSGLLNLINESRHTLDIEQMSFYVGWKHEASGRSPLLDAVVAAASRGVRVRVILNDDAFYAPGGGYYKDTKNKQMVRELMSIAQNRRLPISARIANMNAMGVGTIHNKGVLVDGRETLISSINWNENSVTNNREAAIVLTSNEVNGYFQRLFDQDWQLSEAQSWERANPKKKLPWSQASPGQED